MITTYKPMHREANRGYFITVEGPDGSSKTTQTTLLVEYLQRLHLPVVHLREPGGEQNSEVIRDMLLHPDNHGCEPWEAVSNLMLFSVARRELMSKTIVPALNENKIVVCDRFIDSTIAYQHFGQGIPWSVVRELIQLATDRIVPDKTFFLEVPFEVAQKRIAERAGQTDHFDTLDIERKQRIYDGYLSTSTSPQSVVINANQTRSEVAAEIKAKFAQHILPTIIDREIG